jgi:hypothetical protein
MSAQSNLRHSLCFYSFNMITMRCFVLYLILVNTVLPLKVEAGFVKDVLVHTVGQIGGAAIGV